MATLINDTEITMFSEGTLYSFGSIKIVRNGTVVEIHLGENDTSIDIPKSTWDRLVMDYYAQKDPEPEPDSE